MDEPVHRRLPPKAPPSGLIGYIEDTLRQNSGAVGLVFRSRMKILRTRAVRQAVFNTTELLEQILLSLPPRDTIVSMRVCKRWYECVHASPTMPQHLFLRSEGLYVRQVVWQRESPYIGLAKFDFARTMARLASLSDEVKNDMPDIKLRDCEGTLLTPVRLCPLLYLEYPNEPPIRRFWSRLQEDTRQAYMNVGPWEAMLLCDPPCIEVEALVTSRHAHLHDLGMVVMSNIVNPEGLRMRDVKRRLLTSTGVVCCNFKKHSGAEAHPAMGRGYWEDVKVGDKVAEIIELYGDHFEVEEVLLGLDGVLVAGEEDWAAIDLPRKRRQPHIYRTVALFGDRQRQQQHLQLSCILLIADNRHICAFPRLHPFSTSDLSHDATPSPCAVIEAVRFEVRHFREHEMAHLDPAESTAAQHERPPGDTSMQATMQAVFDITELLEMILLALPPRDTIVCMRAYKQWGDCVRASMAISKHLFLKPEGVQVRQMLWEVAKSPAEVATNKFAQTMSNKASLDSTDRDDYGHVIQYDKVTLTPVRLCPLVELCFPEKRTEKRFEMRCLEWTFPSLPDKTGPWSDMLLCDPPCTEIEIHAEFDYLWDRELGIDYDARFTNSNGFTLGDVGTALSTGTGSVTCFFPPDWGEVPEMQTDHLGMRDFSDAKVYDVMEQITGLFGGKFELDFLMVALVGAVVPDEKDWASIECKKV